jgi:hypothetical protein
MPTSQHHSVTVPNPDGDGRIAATYYGVTDQPVWIDAPGVVGGGYFADTARVRYEEGVREGTTGLVNCWKIRPQ